GDGYAVAILAIGPDFQSIEVSRANAQGSIVDARPLTLTTAGAYPAVASAEGAYLVSWQENGGIRGALLPATGNPGGTLSIVPPPPTTSSTIEGSHFETATASQYLVGWLWQQPAENGATIDQLARVARVGTDGTVYDPNGLTLPGTGSFALAIASDGMN